MFAYCLNNPITYSDPSGSIAVFDDALLLAGFCLAVFPMYVLTVKLLPTILDPLVDTLNNVINTFVTVVEEGMQILTAKAKGKNRMRDSGLADETDAEVSKKARDKNLPTKERERYKTEEKAHGLRNKQKREELYTKN